MRPFEGEGFLSFYFEGQLEDHCVLPESGHELPTALDAGHPHHLGGLDIVVERDEVVDDLVVTGLGVHRIGRRLPAADGVGEAGVGGVQVQEAGANVPRVAEAVEGAWGGGDERSGACLEGGVLEREVDLALENVERVVVVVMPVWIDALARVEGNLQRGQLRKIGLDQDDAVVAVEPLALIRTGDDRVHGRRLWLT